MSARRQQRWTVADLKSVPPGAMQLCRECGAEYSANPSDYFAASPDTVLTCCDRPVSIVVQHTIYMGVKK